MTIESNQLTRRFLWITRTDEHSPPLRVPLDKRAGMGEVPISIKYIPQNLLKGIGHVHVRRNSSRLVLGAACDHLGEHHLGMASIPGDKSGQQA
jgi:hypothetical protein